KEGQIPCRWVPDMGYGFGFPLFNFYPPLPYLVGQVIHSVGYDFVSTAKALFIVAFVVSGITMYFLGKEFFGKWGGVLSAIFYIWAPYHSVDIYVRGAMNESWALIWFPLILWSSYRLIKDKQKYFKWIVILALAWFALLTSHNLMVLAIGVPFSIWCLIWLFKYKSWKKIPILAISGFWAIGLAAFFTFPVLLENKFTHIDSVLVGYYDYSGHFATINQILFSRFWGYGPSVWLENDGMSFQVGHIHWVLSILLFLFFVYKKFIKKEKLNDLLIVVFYMFIVGWFAAFLTHVKSTPIWLAVPQLKYLQFPWRLLSLVILSFSFMAGSLVTILPKKLSTVILFLLAFGLISFNWSYFKPEHGKLGPLTDQEKLSGAAWDLQQTAGIYDYLPIYAYTAPKAPQKFVAENARGEMQISNASQGTNWAKFDVEVTSDKGWVRVGIFKFPGWHAYDNGKETEIQVPDEEKWGRMWIELPKGSHHIGVKFTNTPIRTIGNTISVISWLTLIIFILRNSSFKKKHA
ncbi:YfhO family protein, partial [Candidatus Microgenomates bacterium]|nr:YfhO family protein [Candidatus Microgenomates bacterium]